jgi:hypothetical protein
MQCAGSSDDATASKIGLLSVEQALADFADLASSARHPFPTLFVSIVSNAA